MKESGGNTDPSVGRTSSETGHNAEGPGQSDSTQAIGSTAVAGSGEVGAPGAQDVGRTALGGAGVESS